MGIERLVCCGSTQRSESAPFLASDILEKDKTTMWRVQIGQLKLGEPAYITVLGQDCTNDSKHFSETACMEDTIVSAGKRKRPSRPCKGKRERYRNFVERLKMEISANPESFRMENIALPPSLVENARKRENLMHFIECYRREVRAHTMMR